jgi:hypothetical protein
MKPWIHEEILKTWTDAQKRLWESLCSAVPFQPPAGVEAWRETYLKNLASWEAAVKRTLEKEAAWVEEWVQRVAREKGTPEMMASWVRQMEEVLHRWIQTQNQWWDDYFAVLRRGGFAQPDQFDAQPTIVAETVSRRAQPAVTIEPTAVEKPPATAESPPAILEPVIAWAEARPRSDCNSHRAKATARMSTRTCTRRRVGCKATRRPQAHQWHRPRSGKEAERLRCSSASGIWRRWVKPI